MDAVSIIGNYKAAAKAHLNWDGTVEVVVFINHKRTEPIKAWSYIANGPYSLYCTHIQYNKYSLMLKFHMKWSFNSASKHCFYILNSIRICTK